MCPINIQRYLAVWSYSRRSRLRAEGKVLTVKISKKLRQLFADEPNSLDPTKLDNRKEE